MSGHLRFRSASCRSGPVWVLLDPVSRDVDPAADPHAVVPLDVVEEAREGGGPARPPHEPHVIALDLLADELIVDPLPAVAHDLVAGLDDRGRGLGVALERHGYGEDADLDAVRCERAHEAPEADAATILVHRLDL